MLRVPCPYCGVRDETEFSFGGEAHIARPGPDATDAAWTEYLYLRDNPKGVNYERWCHSYGCGRWFHAARHTVTHRFLAIYAATEPRPVLPPEDGR